MSNRGYDVVVDVDSEGDLGHTDLQDDNLEFHPSNFDDPNNNPKPPPTSHIRTASKSHTRSGSTSLASRRYLWTLNFYAQFFDVNTDEVLRRCGAALYPRSNFLDVLDGNPDLYGPFWIATTVVVILFLTGTMNWALAHRGSAKFGYDFGLLSGSAGLIYGYTGVIPLGFWLALKYLAASHEDAAAVSLLETWALYGYANLIWIPVALVSWSPLDALNYAFVGIGFAASAFFLVRNLLPVINAASGKRAKVLVLVVVLLHAGLAIAIKVLFFAHKSPVRGSTRLPSGDAGGGRPAEAGETDTDGEGDAAKLVARMALGL